MARIEIQTLEQRLMFSALRTPPIEPTYRVREDPVTLQPLQTVGPNGNTPSQLRHGYGFDNLIVGNGLIADGSGQTVVIIDAFDNPQFVTSSDPNYGTSDLFNFDAAFGLPQFGQPGGPTFTKVNQSGGTIYPTADTGWGTEIALDVEWVHAMAPGANIILVEANSTSYADLVTGAVGWARMQSGVSVVSMSFGGGEFFGESSFDGTFTTPSGHNGITFIAASGDHGKPGLYPAYSPNVLAVGGTSLTLSGSDYLSETGWSGSGGGISGSQGRESKPLYQSGITLSNTRRMIPDVSIVADPNTGVPVFDSFGEGSAAPWVQVGGTSLSSPLWGAIIAITDQVRSIAGRATLNGRNDTLPGLYSMSSADFHDITTGNNGFSALAGYDLVTGRGTPKVDLIVGDFVGAAPTKPDLPGAYDSGASNSDNVTNLANVHFTGSATSGLIVQIVSDGVVVGSGTAAGGNYDIAVSGLSDGQHLITARDGARASSGLTITIDTSAPAVIDATFTFDTAHAVLFTFSEDVSTKVAQNSATVAPAGGGSLIALTGFGYDAGSNVAAFDLPLAMDDGNYTATLATAGITDLAGNSMAPVSLDFFVLAGDANHDRVVDINDFAVLTANLYGNGKTFSQGDFNYDGVVDNTDLGILASRWQTVLSPPPPSISAATAFSFATAPTRTATRPADVLS